MTAPSTLDMYTTVKNLTGATHVFGYIPPHGQNLLPGQQYSTFGDLWDVISIPPIGSKRKRQALERDLLNNPPRIAILSSPKPMLFDATPPAALANPSVAVTEANTGATVTQLASGAYYIAYTFVTADGGETTIGTGEIAAPVTLTHGTSKPRVTLPALPSGAASINLYLSAPGGASGSEVLYATGITTTTYDLVSAAPGFAVPPGSNSTTLANPTIVPIIDLVAGGDTGGLLQAGLYYLKYTFTSAIGETTDGGLESIQFNVVAGTIPMAQLPALPAGALAANIYLTQAGGGSGTETFYMTSGGGDQVFLSIAQTASGAAFPVSNTAKLTPPSTPPIVVAPITVNPVNGAPINSELFEQYDFLQPPRQGGRMTIGNYLAQITFVDLAGHESTPSNESLSFSITADGQMAVVIMPFEILPAGIASANLYVTPPNGASLSEVLAISGIKQSAVLLVSKIEGHTVPQRNSTGGSYVVAPAVADAVLGVADPSWGAYKFPQ